MKIILILFILSIESIYSWPGDQASLACLTKPKRDDIMDQFYSRGDTYSKNGLTKEQNQAEAIAEVKKAVRANHDMDFEVTKLGDSLSDLVDFYGVATPRKLFPNLGDAGGTFGGNPIYMDSWDDYMSAGAVIVNGFKFQNFGKSGNTTLATMGILGIDIRPGDDKENWEVLSTATRCVKTRALERGALVLEPTDAILKEKSSMRSTLMINGNDIIQALSGFNGWMPFLNQYQVDSSLLNIMAITDWHLENGKQIFLEGTIPPYSLPAWRGYNTTIANRLTLCKPLNDLLVDIDEIPWYVILVPGVLAEAVRWNIHVANEVTRFFEATFGKEPRNNTSSVGGFLNQVDKVVNENIDILMEAAVSIYVQTDPFVQTLLPDQRDAVMAAFREKKVLNALFEKFNNEPFRIISTSASIAQACLNDRIKNNMLPGYKQEFPKNVDGYPLYSNFNLTGDSNTAANFWVPTMELYRQRGLFGRLMSGSFGLGGKIDDGPYGIFNGQNNGEFLDPIHIGPEGYKLWGTLIGPRLSALGYQNPGDPNTIPIEVALELNDAWGIIRKKARDVGVIGMELGARGITVKPSVASFGGFYRNYSNGSGIYLKLYTSNRPELHANERYKDGAIHLSKSVNTLFKNNGGPEGKLGFPIGGTRCWGPGAFCNYKLTLFEKGYIQVDETPFFSSGPEIAVAVSDVPDSKKDSDPDFDTCVSTACGSRMIFHSKFYLQPTAGKAPFTFKVIGGSLPPGFELTPSGLLIGGPTNNPTGEWTFKVAVIDSKSFPAQVNSQIKTLTFKSYL